MKLRLAYLLVGLAGCYSPSLDAAPFACSLGPCPSGYRCVDEICIGNNAPTPPPLVAEVGAADVPAVPLWTGSAFSLMWKDETGQLSGLQLTPFADGVPDYEAEQLLTDDTNITGAAALFDESVKQYAVAYTQNIPNQSTALKVLSADSTGTQTTPLFEHDEGPSQLGFSPPSITLSNDTDVVVGYTFESGSDNAFCERIPIATAAARASCQSASLTGAYDSALITALDPTLYFHVREVSPEQVDEVQSGSTEVTPLAAITSALGTARIDANIFLLAQRSDGSSQLSARPAGTPSIILPALGTPSIATDGTKLFVCFPGATDDPAPTIYTYDTSLSQVGSVMRIARISTAPVISCRIAASPTQLFVAWYEGATTFFRLYGATIAR